MNETKKIIIKTFSVKNNAYSYNTVYLVFMSGGFWFATVSGKVVYGAKTEAEIIQQVNA